jgi:hypothetical protein
MRLLLCVWMLLLASCSTTSGGFGAPGVRSCDRNGDYEQRVACEP